MKIQAYNPGNKFSRFTEIVVHDGRANSLHYKTSFAVLHHIEKLGNRIPGLQDAARRITLPFVTPEFKVLESSATDKSIHKVAVIYISDTMTLIDSFGDYLLLAMGDQSAAIVDETVETFLLAVQDNLSIINYRQLVGKGIEKSLLSSEIQS
jgi:hypothetical protein